MCSNGDQAGKETSPSAALVDSQRVRTTKSGEICGFDVVKKVCGCGQHLLTGTVGLKLLLVVYASDIQTLDGLAQVCWRPISAGLETKNPPHAAFVSWCMANCGNEKIAEANLRTARVANWTSGAFQLADRLSVALSSHVHLSLIRAATSVFLVDTANSSFTLLGGNQKNEKGKDSVCIERFELGDVREFRWLDWKA